MSNTRDTGYLRNLVAYDASGNITLPANLTVNGTIIGYVTTAALASSLAGYVPTSRTITINGITLDLSANRSFTVTSMVYPSAGIAVSTGSAWGTSITDNSTNWNTAYGWGNHASAGYLTSALAATTYASLTGSYANPTWITALAYSKITGVPAFLTSYTETDTLATVTARGSSTTAGLTINGDTVITSANGRYLGFTGFTTGMTVDFRFGDINNRVVCTYASTMNVESYHGVVISNTNLGSAANAALRVMGRQAGKAILELATGTTLYGAMFYTGNVLLQNGGTYTDNGYRLDVNGTARIVNDITAASFTKSGGTASQFLKADGTVDSSSYYLASNPSGYTTNTGTVTSVAALTIGTIGTDVTSTVATGTTTAVITLNIPTASAANRGALSAADWTTFNAKQAALSGTGFVKITGTTISYDNSTYLTTSAAATTYLPLAGGTLTGPLGGTSATFSANVTINSVIIGTDVTYGTPYRVVAFGSNADGSNRILAANNTTDGMYFMAATGTGFNFRPNGGTVNLVSISSTGATTFSSTVGINTTSPYDPTQFSLDVNGGLLVKNVGKAAQIVLINSNPAAGGNNAYVVHTVGGSLTTSYVDIQGYYGANITGSTTIRLNNAGGNVLIGSLIGTGTRMVVVDATGVLSTQAIPSGGTSGVTSFNTRTGAVTLSSADVTGALGFTPYNATNPSGYITSSGSISGTSAGVSVSLTGANATNVIYATIADNDFFRIRVGGDASNAGWAEIATADDGTEPIYVRQYTGVFSSLTRTATLLDGSGNTSFPGTVTAPTFSGALSGNATTASSISGYNNPTTAATANTIVYRDGNGHITGNYILGSYFNSSAGNSENPTIGQIWTQSTSDNYLRKSTPAHFISQLGLITTSSIGSQSVNYAAYSGYSNMNPLMSIRDFTSGTLVQTSINYGVTSGDPFILEIRGNSYGNGMPWDIQIQGYIYADTIINTGGYSNGSNITGLRAINYNGNLCFWWPRQGYWHGFTVRAYTAYDGRQLNKVTSISDSSQPTTAKQYDFSIAQSLRTDNAAYAWNMNQYVRTTDNVSFARVDATNYGVGNAIYFNGGNNYLNWSGGIHTNVAFTSDTYVYASGSIRLGDMWSGGGLYRPSGNMVFGIENSDWIFSKGAVTQAYFAGGDGNLWMRWAGDWLSNLLGAKQNASTAITTSNIGSQNVSYAGSAGVATYTSPNYAGGVQTNPQVYFNNGIGLKVAMTGYVSTWSDTLWINGYTGGDVPWMCALHTIRNSQPRMWISAQTRESTSYGTPYEFITAWNIASQSVNYANSAGAVGWSSVSGKPGWLDTTNLIIDSDPNTLQPSGFYQNYASGNNPTGTWFNYINVRHSNPGNGHGYQLGMSYYDNNLWFRSYQGSGTFQSWSRALATATDPYAANMNQYVRTNSSMQFYDMALSTSGTASDWYANGWFRNNSNNCGLYSQANGLHFYASSGTDWNITGSGGGVALVFRANHQSTIRGYVHGDTSSNFGLLNSIGGWAVRCFPGGGYGGELTGSWTSTGDLGAYSDARVKENVQTIEQGLEKVLKLRGVSYNRTDGTDKSKKIGVIAQETKTIVPEVVNENAEGMYSVSYGNLAGLFIEAFKEQQAQIEDLKKQIAFLVENK